MRLAVFEVKDVLGLTGTVNLLKNPTLFYGRNLAGKTNIINLIRYCFVLGKAGKKYSESKRLDKNELLLDKVSNGTATFYFEHASKLYKLEYLFRRTSRSVGQKIALFQAPRTVILDAKAEETVKHLKWEVNAQGSKEFRDKFEELGIYSDVIDLLISPSNVKHFADAINNELVTVPDIIARQVSLVHNGATKLLSNFDKLQSVLVQEKENYVAKFKHLLAEFQERSTKPPSAIANIFVIGNTYASLDFELKETDRELSELPSQETQLLLFKQRWATEFSDKYRNIANAKQVLNEKAQVVELKQKAAMLIENARMAETWSVTFKALPSKDNVQALEDFIVPPHESSAFQNLLNPIRIRKIFDLLEGAKTDLKTSSQIAQQYEVVLALSELRSLASAYRKLTKSIKSPEEKPDGVECVVCYFEDEKESAVYIPIDALMSNPNYLRGIRPTPSVYRTKTLGKTELDRLAKAVETKVKDLEACRDRLSLAGNQLDEAKKLVPLMSNEVSHLNQEKSQADKLIQERLSNWRTTATLLVETFKVEPRQMELDTMETIDEFTLWLSKIVKKCEERFVAELKEAMKLARIEVGRDFKMDDAGSFDAIVAQQSKEVLQRKDSLQKAKDWINANLNEVKEVESELLTIAYVEKVIMMLDIILKQIEQHTNLNMLSEQIAHSIEENVRRCVELILPDEMMRFRHVGMGKFLIEARTGEAVTHPGGSHKAVISLGIMLTLSKNFDLPLILDEARDRFDNIALKNTFHFVDMLCKEPRSPQICFVSYRTLDIEKDPDTLNILRNWNIYMVEKHGDSKTITKTNDLAAISE
jgi:hypothetical protein